MEKSIIYPNVSISETATIGIGCIIYPNVIIGENVFIGPYSIIGEPTAGYYKNPDCHEFMKTVIGDNSVIRSHSVIYEGVEIGSNFQSGHRVTIREKTVIGRNSSVGTLSDIQGYVEIGEFVRMHSNVHIGQMSKIENYVWIYPYVVLTNDPYPPMNDLRGVTLKEFCQVATSSVIMPGVTIGKNALIGAQSLVRKDVAEERVVVGVPGKDVCSVTELKNDKGEQIYPWKDFLKDFRGYPWQEKA